MRRDKRDRQKRRKLLAELWKQLETPGIEPETAQKITKQIAKLEGDGPTDKDAGAGAKSPKHRFPAAWPEGHWRILAIERLAWNISTAWDTQLDAAMSRLKPEERDALSAEARWLSDPATLDERCHLATAWSDREPVVGGSERAILSARAACTGRLRREIEAAEGASSPMPPNDAERLARTIPQPTPPVFTAADAFRHWHGGAPDPQPLYSNADFTSEVTALPDAKR